ncbi:hypothetical protein ACHAWO_008633 [Cyclotella atomus]|uniref:Uncharacterized protein n=1 Tax=Cyclotella atomus TaxID=382360 RepID=A0ABD3MXA9_9STRA
MHHRTSTQAGLRSGPLVWARRWSPDQSGAAAGGAKSDSVGCQNGGSLWKLSRIIRVEAFVEGRTPLGVVQYMVDQLIKSDKLQRLDGILSMVV